MDTLGRVRAYLAAIEQGATGPELARFFSPEVIQEELPNRVTPRGARRDLAAILDAATRGQQVARGQRFEVHHALAVGDRVALEATWTGTLATAVGSLAEGQQLRARVAMFIELREGLIIAQRSYDCFEPF